eukprot:m.85523 g.85523  ORF g.85523 m.85523 type:complete len:452 (+) comp12781_c0_seq3:455-1810(+)
MAAKLDKLSDEALKKEPEEVFDLLEKLGEGSYGSVHKALRKDTGHTLAVKIVAVDTDLQEIIKEISIMQQCNSDQIVKYFGSYFKSKDLWIVMEYCGGGSVADIMRLRKKPLGEKALQPILKDSLQGLSYLHSLRKIHRDIKAGNILLSDDGQAKLADFGVAGQLSDSLAKRNTVIGTPYWMAPEIIQEIGHDMMADIWSLGITTIEMVEGKPPHANIHPMRAIFMIPTNPPPQLREPDQHSKPLASFLSKCLVKDPSKRQSAAVLLTHPFITAAQPAEKVVKPLIDETKHIIASRGRYPQDDEESSTADESSEDVVDDSTIVRDRTTSPVNVGTMVVREEEEVMSEAGTMVVTDPDEQDDTMKAACESSYKPSFLMHFDEDQGSKDAAPSNPPPSAQTQQLSEKEIRERLASLEKEMESELEELRRLYEAKREPITRAIEAKRLAEQKAS